MVPVARGTGPVPRSFDRKVRWLAVDLRSIQGIQALEKYDVQPKYIFSKYQILPKYIEIQNLAEV